MEFLLGCCTGWALRKGIMWDTGQEQVTCPPVSLCSIRLETSLWPRWPWPAVWGPCLCGFFKTSHRRSIVKGASSLHPRASRHRTGTRQPCWMLAWPGLFLSGKKCSSSLLTCGGTTPRSACPRSSQELTGHFSCLVFSRNGRRDLV